MRSLLAQWLPRWDTRSRLAERVIELASEFRVAVHNPPTNERDIQNWFEGLLKGFSVATGIDYRRESDSIPYATKSYIPDFTLPELSMAVEIKLCNRPNREKELIAEINDDILAYRTRFTRLLFLIYDTGHIRDAPRFCSAFHSDRVVVLVVKQ